MALCKYVKLSELFSMHNIYGISILDSEHNFCSLHAVEVSNLFKPKRNRVLHIPESKMFAILKAEPELLERFDKFKLERELRLKTYHKKYYNTPKLSEDDSYEQTTES